MSAATHGMIRTSHAARSIAQSQTTFRIHELAERLAYWASRYLTLPGRASKREEIYDPCTALDHVQRIHDSDFDSSGPIFQQIGGLDDHPDFAGATGLVDTGDDLSVFISSITETFAGVYIANQTGTITFVHTVTVPSLIRILAPFLSDADYRPIARYAWQACAGIYAQYASSIPPSATFKYLLPQGDRDEYID